MERLIIAQWKQLITVYLPLYVAIEEGLFKRQRLRIDMRQVGNDDDVFRWVATGKASFGVGDPTFCARQENLQYQAKVVATLVDRVAAFGITLNPVLQPIEVLEDLVNVRIGTYPRPSTTYSVIAATQAQNKRLLKSLEIIEGPIGRQLQQLRASKCDVVMDIEPFISIAEAEGCRVVYNLADFHGPFCTTGFYTSQSFINKKPQIVQAAVNALDQALQLLASDREVAYRVTKKLYPKLDDKTIKRSLRRLYDSHIWRRDARTMESSWKNAIQIRKSLGECFLRIPFSAVDNTFAEKALKLER